MPTGPGSWDKEFKITWFELAPSLQTILQTIQSEISVLQNNYTVLVNTLDQMNIKITTNINNININTQEINILKSTMGTLTTTVDDLLALLGSIDVSKLGDLSDLRADIDQCIVDIQELFRRMRVVEKKSEQNFNDIVDLRIDVDNNTEWINWLSKLAEDIPDLRTDIDNNTEWLSSLQRKYDVLEDDTIDLKIDMDHNVEWMQHIHDRMEGFIDEIVNLRIDIDLTTEWYSELKTILEDFAGLDPEKIKNLQEDIVDARTDIDNNTEWINWLSKLAEDIPDLRTDIDNNTEWLSSLDKYIDDIVDLTMEVYRNIEDINKNREDILGLVDDLTEHRTDIDINTELIKKLFDDLAALPDELMGKVLYYIDKMRFLNLAPKINFLQEDTVECTPYYYMNNMTKFVMTSDLDGAEIIYFIANDGLATTEYDLFYGYRNNDTQSFYFSNTALTPMVFRDSGGNKVSHITDILTADNNYLVVYNNFDSGAGVDGWYLINTGSSRNAGSWTTCKSLAPIWSSSIVGMKYFEEYDVLFVFSKDPNYADLREPRIAILRTYQFSTLSLIASYDLIHPMQILSCNTATTSFHRAHVESNFLLGNVADIGYGIDHIVPSSKYTVNNFKMLFTVYEEEELLVMELFNANILYTRVEDAVPGNTKFEAPHCYIKLTFDCPKSIMQGGSSAIITCLQNYGDLVFDYTDTSSDFFTQDIDSSYASVSYAAIKDISYRNWREFETYYSWFHRYTNREQRPVAITDMQKYGTINPYKLSDPLMTPDASPWGKWLFKYIMAWDRFFINSSSSLSQSNVVMIKEWVPDILDSTAIVAKAGQYMTIDPIEIFTEYGSSSCRMSDSSARYFHCNYTGSAIEVYEYGYVETSTNFVINKNLLKTVPVNQTSWVAAASAATNVKTPSFNPLTTSVFYNANSDDFVVFFIDNTNNSSSWPQSDYGFLATVNSSGTIIKVFGSASISSYSSNWGTINTYVQANKSVNGVLPRLRCMTFLSSTSALCCYYYINSVGDIDEYRNVSITFNAGKTSMSMANAYNYVEKQYVSELARGTGVIYSGPDYGITYSGENLDNTYTVFLTQRKIPGMWGSNLSDNQFISGTYNRYKIQLKSSSGLIVYIPNIAIFLGGYFTQLEAPLSVILYPSSVNYVYIERDPVTLDIIAYARKKKFMNEGARTFNKICIAKITTNSDDVINLEYYRINIGYNDYTF